MSIGNRLKEERIRLTFSQPSFALIAQTTKKSQIEYEKGVRFPNAVYLSAIAAAGADIRYIVTGVRDGPPPEALSANERELLTLFRASSLAGKAAAIGAMQGVARMAPSQKRGKVGTAARGRK